MPKKPMTISAPPNIRQRVSPVVCFVLITELTFIAGLLAYIAFNRRPKWWTANHTMAPFTALIFVATAIYAFLRGMAIDSYAHADEFAGTSLGKPRFAIVENY
jgi:hypothetical protein